MNQSEEHSISIQEQKSKIRERYRGVDPDTLERLMQVTEFRRAYLEDGLAPEEFFTFGVTQKTLSQFVETGWAMLEVYGSNKMSTRWT